MRFFPNRHAMSRFRRQDTKCDPPRKERGDRARARNGNSDFERVVREEVRRFEYDLRELAKS
jgi:hypothetical protein